MQHFSSRHSWQQRSWQRTLSTMAAILVVAVLLGAFLVLLNSAHGSHTGGPGVPPTAAHPLKLTFSCHDTPGMGFFVLGGLQGRVCVQTTPGAKLHLVVTLCNGPADNSPVLKGTVQADSTGYYEWNWTAYSPCGPHPGRGTATVTASLDGQSVTQSTSFFGD